MPTKINSLLLRCEIGIQAPDSPALLDGPALTTALGDVLDSFLKRAGYAIDQHRWSAMRRQDRHPKPDDIAAEADYFLIGIGQYRRVEDLVRALKDEVVRLRTEVIQEDSNVQ